MASIPQFYHDCSFAGTDDFTQFSYPVAETALVATEENCLDGGTVSNGGAIWGSISNATSEDNYQFPMSFDHNVLAPEPDLVSPSSMMMPFPEIFDSGVPTLPDYNNMGISGVHQNLGDRFHQLLPHDVLEFADDSKPVYPKAAGENWVIQNNRMPSMEDANIIKVGRYSVEERKDRILRYLKKKNQRNFNKTIKYACRKTLADRRVRVRGRFARNNELICEDEMTVKNNDNIISHKDKELYCDDDTVQIKQDEDWLQEAMASLMYLPYISG